MTVKSLEDEDSDVRGGSETPAGSLGGETVVFLAAEVYADAAFTSHAPSSWIRWAYLIQRWTECPAGGIGNTDEGSQMNRDSSQDARALVILDRASKARRNEWLVFRMPGTYQDRLTLQRAIFYLRQPGQHGVAVEWKDQGTGQWLKLRTPKNPNPQEARTSGSPVLRVRLFTRAAALYHVRRAINQGTAAYDNLSPK
jgi:hypothetical protein